MELNKVIVVATSILLAFATFKSGPELSGRTNYDMHFHSWMIDHGKNYSTPAEREFRYKIFVKNLIKVLTHKNPDYKIGLNHFSDMTLDELKIKYMGYRRMSEPSLSAVYLETGINQAPTNWDWRTKGAVTPVKNQGQCGSCWAFSTTGSLEGSFFLSNSTLASFSEQYLVDCAKNGNYGCDGGEMTNALSYVQKNGIPYEKAYPYTAKDGKCNTKVPKVYKISGWQPVPPNSGSQLQAAVTQQPIAIGVEADQWFSYKSGVFSDPSCGDQLDHGVLLVGYGVDKGSNLQYWLIKNSWSTSWGESGYIRILRDDTKKVQLCGITIEGEYPNIK